MRITVRSGRVEQGAGTVAVYAALEGEQHPERLLPAYTAADAELKKLVNSSGFRGAANEVLFLPRKGRWVVVVGLGKQKKLSLEQVRQFAGTAAKAIRGRSFRQLALPMISGQPVGSPEVAAQALAEGVLLGLYRYDHLRQLPKHARNRKIDAAAIVVERASDVAPAKRGVEKAQVIAEAVAMT